MLGGIGSLQGWCQRPLCPVSRSSGRLRVRDFSQSCGDALATGREASQTGFPTTRCLQLLLLSHFSRARLFATPWPAAYQAPPSMGFPRQEYWSGLPLPSPTRCLSPPLYRHQTEPGFRSAPDDYQLCHLGHIVLSEVFMRIIITSWDH